MWHYPHTLPQNSFKENHWLFQLNFKRMLYWISLKTDSKTYDETLHSHQNHKTTETIVLMPLIWRSVSGFVSIRVRKAIFISCWPILLIITQTNNNFQFSSLLAGRFIWVSHQNLSDSINFLLHPRTAALSLFLNFCVWSWQAPNPFSHGLISKSPSPRRFEQHQV